MPKKTKNIKYYEAVGRRKSATARARLYIVSKNKEISAQNLKIKQGEFFVNKIPVASYFYGDVEKTLYEKPFALTDSKERFAVSVLVKGGGKKGQLEAVVLALSRALEKADSENRNKLKPHKLLTRDSRVRERRKVGTGGKARRKKQSPKR